MLLYEALEKSFEGDEKRTALLYMGKNISAKKTSEGIADAASRLSSFVSSGDVVTVCMPNTPECVYCFYAINRIGAIAHMVHPLTPVKQLKKFMQQANSKLLITLSINLDAYASLASEFPIVSVHPARALGGLVCGLYNLKTKPYRGDRGGITAYDDVPKNRIPPKPTRSDKSTGVLLHSGGTSGEAKLIELSDYSINVLAEHGNEALDTDDAHGKYMLAALPMFHGFGLAMGIHAALCIGCTCVIMPKFDPCLAAKLVKKNKLHILIGVPNLFRSLMKQPAFSGKALKNVYVGFVGGDTAPQDLLDEFNSKMESVGANGRLFEGYGLTETVTVCAVNNFSHNRKRSMGYMLSGLKAAVVDVASGDRLPPNEKGEIVISGDTIMNGYLNNAEENEKTFITIDGEKFVRTGDFGYMDEDGYLYYVQRLKRIIKIAGINVYPKEIEAVATSLDGVSGACAVEYRKNGKPYIALFLTGVEQNEKVVKEKIEKELSRYAVPTIVKTIDALPVTAVMKIDAVKLTALAQKLADEGITK